MNLSDVSDKDLLQEVGRALGHQRGHQCGGAMPAMQSDGCLGPSPATGETAAAAAVNMGVDESGHDCHGIEIAVGGTAGRACADRRDRRARYLNPAGAQQL